MDSQNGLQSDLYPKLSHVEQIYLWEEKGTVYTPEKVDKIIEFLKNFKRFTSLMYWAPRSLSFFEKLLANFPLLSSLKIEFVDDGTAWSWEKERSKKAIECKIKEVIGQFKHLYEHRFSFYREDESPYDCVGETFEYYNSENGYPYLVKKLQYIHHSKKTARYELYVWDDRNSAPKFKEQFGDYSNLSDLMEALYNDYAD